jgi:NADH:ubiquinone oxidoreductase subunit 6 (subunit J)
MICQLSLFTIESFYSYFLYVTAIFFALFVIIMSNPIYSLLSLIIVFFHVLIFLLALKIEFLSLIFLIIYVGAIAILFLFVIMMFNLKQLDNNGNLISPTNTNIKINLILLSYPIIKFCFIIEKYLTIFVINNIINSRTFMVNSLNIQEIITYKLKDILFFSNVFYTYYALIFILSSFILFAAMVGAIIIVLQSPKNK